MKIRTFIKIDKAIVLNFNVLNSKEERKIKKLNKYAQKIRRINENSSKFYGEDKESTECLEVKNCKHRI